MGGEERRLLPSRFEKRYAACPGPRPGSRWPAGARPARGTRTSAARLRTGGEEESPRPLFTSPPFPGGPSGGPTRGLTRTSAARLRMGGEEESPRTGDSNPGCNCLVRGYSPSMHFFWGGDMPRYSPPLPFRGGRAGARRGG